MAGIKNSVRRLINFENASTKNMQSISIPYPFTPPKKPSPHIYSDLSLYAPVHSLLRIICYVRIMSQMQFCLFLCLPMCLFFVLLDFLK